MNTIDHQSLLLQMRMLAARSQGLQELTAPAATPDAKATGVDFGHALKSALDKVNETQKTARALSDKFDAGDPKIDMAEVMVAIQKANVSFQAVTQVRNKLVSAYQDVMNMPI